MFNRLCELKNISWSIRTVLVLIFFLNLVQCWRSYRIDIYDPNYTNLAPEIFEMNSTIDRGQRISFNFNIKRDLTNAFVHVLSVFDGDGIGKQNLVYGNYTVDFCSFLINRRESFLLSCLFIVGEKFGELPKRCPLKKKLYYIENMPVTPDSFTSYAIQGNGTVTLTIMTKMGKELKTCTKSSVSFKLENKFKKNQKTKST